MSLLLLLYGVSTSGSGGPTPPTPPTPPGVIPPTSILMPAFGGGARGKGRRRTMLAVGYVESDDDEIVLMS